MRDERRIFLIDRDWKVEVIMPEVKISFTFASFDSATDFIRDFSMGLINEGKDMAITFSIRPESYLNEMPR